jgi:adhesin/invasin
MHNRLRSAVRAAARGLVAAGIAATSAACDEIPLLAPTSSTIVITAQTSFLPPGGITTVTAYVLEQAGTPVNNGTTVRFTASQGRVEPVDVQTVNGYAVTTFIASSTSGIAQIRASSGGATGGDGNTNLVEITVGAAAINSVTLRANPGSVGPGGGTVELIAAVVGEGGQPIPGVAVTFSTDQGVLGGSNMVTDSGGEARTTLTTTQQAVVSASAGTKTSGSVTVGVRSGPIVTISCAPASGGGNCAAVQAAQTTNTATVVFTITRPSGSSTLRSAVIEFGDGTSQGLGNLAGGTATVTHTYNGPSGTVPVAYTATVLSVDVNGESASVATTVTVTPKPPLTPISVTITAAGGTATAAGQAWTLTANVSGGGEGTANAPIESYSWDFGDGQSATTSGSATAHVYQTGLLPQRFTISVTVRTPDGRTANGRTEIVVSSFP